MGFAGIVETRILPGLKKDGALLGYIYVRRLRLILKQERWFLPSLTLKGMDTVPILKSIDFKADGESLSSSFSHSVSFAAVLISLHVHPFRAITMSLRLPSVLLAFIYTTVLL